MDVVRVMIVEDSPTVRFTIAEAIGADPRLKVVALCESAEQALARIDRVAPDVVSMDIHLPGMSGLDATRRIMEQRPTPIVIVSRSVMAEDLDSTMEALRAGAVSAVEKPANSNSAAVDDMLRRLCRELVIMSQVKVVRQRFNRRRPAPLPSTDRALRPNSPNRIGMDRALTRPAPFAGRALSKAQTAIIGVVASTGGPRALQCILESIGPGFSLPLVVVQHITTSFHLGFIDWLARAVPQPVTEAIPGETPLAGHVYVAPAARHLVLRGERLGWDARATVNGHCPSGNILLKSIAESYGPRAAGVVLTGMGNDGADGLLAIRKAGGYTITEDESTAVVNGMPQAARDVGASCVALPLESIGAAIRNLAPTMLELPA